MNTKLEVMICTCRENGLQRTAKMQLPKVDGVGYLISCQSDPLPIPDELNRDDVRIVFSKTSGLSNNRNIALSHVKAPYAIVADDDLNYYADGLRALIQAFDENSDIDVMTFRFKYPYQLTYPADGYDFKSKCKNYNIVSFEIGFRMEGFRKYGINFSNLLGIGAPYLACGEEDILIYNCKRKGCKMLHRNITVGEHPDYQTLSIGINKPAAVRAQGAVITLMYPYTSLPRLLLKAKRLNGNYMRNLYHLSMGAVYAIYHRREILV